MSEPPAPASPIGPASIESLLAESAWVRRLARRLASDGAPADDLEQETWLAALAHPPEDGRPARPWLARVLANLARMSRRSERHRDERERASARSELHSPSDSVERLELQRLLVDALSELDEPYRTTVIARYFDGLSSVEIARRERIPAGTVRWRLSEGLARLRTTLDRRHGGDRSAWCALFAPFLDRATLAPTATAAALTTKVAVMTVAQRVAVASIALVVASIALWTFAAGDRDERGSSEVDRDVSLVDAQVAQPPVARELSAAAPRDARVPAVDAVAVAVHATTVSDAARIQARFIDAGGRALAGVRVLAPSAASGAPLSSGPDGGASFDVAAREAPENVLFSAALDGFATHFSRVRVERAHTTELGDVVLAAGGSLVGRVVDVAGAPLAGARVLVTQPHLVERADWLERDGPTTDPGVPESTSAEDGTFRVDGVPAQLVRVWASVSGMRFAYTPPLEVPERAAKEGVELVIRPFEGDECIRGVVLDADGRPVRGAVVYAYYSTAEASGAREAVSGSDGRFQIVVRVNGEHEITAHDATERSTPVTIARVESGTSDLVLRFGARPMLRVRAVSESGAALDTFAVVLADATGARSFAFDGMRAHADGESTLTRPDEPFVVRVDAPGFAETELGPFEPASATEPIVARLARLPGVRGRVTASGEPVAGAKLVWHRLVSDHERVECDGFATRVQPFPEESVESDARGEFWITAREGGPHAILCDADGFATAEVAPIDVDPSVGVHGVEIALTIGGAIEGRVLSPGGRDPAGTIVAAHRYDARPRTVRVGRDGVFRFERLTPGGWCVRRVQHEFDPEAGATVHVSGEPARFDTDVDVHVGEVTRFDLRVAEPAIVRAELSWGGSPAVGWTAAVWNRGTRVLTRDRRPPGAAFDASGIATIEVLEPGEYALFLSSPTEFAVPLTIDVPVTLVPGANPWSASIETGAVEGQVDVAPAVPLVEILWRRDDGEISLRARMPLDTEGKFRAPQVPVGRVIVRATWPAEVARERRVVDREVDVRRGETARVEVP